MSIFAARPVVTSLIALAIAIATLCFAYATGVKHERARWEQKQSERRAKVYETVVELSNERYQLEHRLIAANANVENLMNVRINQNETRKNAIKHDHNTGAVQLRLPTSTCAHQSRASQTTTSTTSGHAAAGCELSTADAGFLIDLAARADEIVYKLTACQQRLTLCITPELVK